MATQSIKNLILSQVEPILERAETAIREEGQKKVGELESKIPSTTDIFEKLKSEMNEKYRCDFETHKKELWQLREMAKKKNNVQTAVRAEELRAKAAGLHVDKILTATKNMNSLENLSLEELEERLQNINRLYGNVLGDKGDKEDDIK